MIWPKFISADTALVVASLTVNAAMAAAISRLPRIFGERAKSVFHVGLVCDWPDRRPSTSGETCSVAGAQHRLPGHVVCGIRQRNPKLRCRVRRERQHT